MSWSIRLQIAVNLLIMVYKLMWNAKLRIKKWYGQAKHIKEMKRLKTEQVKKTLEKGIKKNLELRLNPLKKIKVSVSENKNALSVLNDNKKLKT